MPQKTQLDFLNFWGFPTVQIEFLNNGPYPRKYKNRIDHEILRFHRPLSMNWQSHGDRLTDFRKRRIWNLDDDENRNSQKILTIFLNI